MSSHCPPAPHNAVAKRLEPVTGHFQSVIAMIKGNRPCTDIAQHLHAVEKSILQARRSLIQDHIDHCLEDLTTGEGNPPALSDFKAITSYL